MERRPASGRRCWGPPRLPTTPASRSPQCPPPGDTPPPTSCPSYAPIPLFAPPCKRPTSHKRSLYCRGCRHLAHARLPPFSMPHIWSILKLYFYESAMSRVVEPDEDTRVRLAKSLLKMLELVYLCKFCLNFTCLIEAGKLAAGSLFQSLILVARESTQEEHASV